MVRAYHQKHRDDETTPCGGTPEDEKEHQEDLGHSMRASFLVRVGLPVMNAERLNHAPYRDSHMVNKVSDLEM